MEPDPYVRWQLGTDRRVHRSGGASALVVPGPYGLTATLLGEVADQPGALAVAVESEPERPVRVNAHPDAVPLLGLEPATRWEWMLHDGAAPGSPARVSWLDRTWTHVLTTLLAEHSPTAHAHPGDPDVRGWAGVVEDGVLVAAGASIRNPAGLPHLRAIAVHQEHRRRGLGRDVTAFMTAEAIEVAGACSLGLFSDNDVARGLYEALGYRLVRRFGSAPLPSDWVASLNSAGSASAASAPDPARPRREGAASCVEW